MKIDEILPKTGLVYSEKSKLPEVMCKPKIMPIKSMTLDKIERMHKEAIKASQEAAMEAKRLEEHGPGGAEGATVVDEGADAKEY
eukprot:573726-Amorphochlora_amoeboformis.AAC.1